jgi:hypothetical protein
MVKIIIVLMAFLILSTGCLEEKKTIDIDMENDKGDRFIGTAECIDNQVVYYDVVCYVIRMPENGHRTTGKIYLNKNRETGFESTNYDLYQNGFGLSSHYSGSAPLVECTTKYIGFYEQSSYVEAPVFLVEYIDNKIVIRYDAVEGFDLI